MRRHLCCLAILGLVLTGGLSGASELSQVTQKANHLIALNRLGLTADQLARILPTSRRLADGVQARQAERQRLLQTARPSLLAARKALAAGTPLPQETQLVMDKLEADLQAADETEYEAAVKLLAEVSKAFYPQQDAYVDWTPPRVSRSSSRKAMQEQARAERTNRALILAAERQMSSMRMSDFDSMEQRLYIARANRIADDFLRPLIDPDSPQYEAAHAYMVDVLKQVRLMTRDEWADRNYELAEQLVTELGLLDTGQATSERKAYTWQDMYAIFADAGAPDMLEAMVKARKTE
jgi:hypothetical protein